MDMIGGKSMRISMVNNAKLVLKLYHKKIGRMEDFICYKFNALFKEKALQILTKLFAGL